MIKLIAIVEKNFGLSKDGKIPWEFSEDRAFFQEMTQNSIVIMGRNTFFSHKNFPLKNRINCVITKKAIPDVTCFSTLEGTIKNYPDAWIIGGAKLYNYALQKDLVDEAIITQVNQEYEADEFLCVKYLENFDRELLKKEENYKIWKLKKPPKRL
jgi:dihydrofolate reductase